MRIRAAAKINLALNVFGRRTDGYHDVDMIMQSVSLYDELEISPSDSLSLSVSGDAPATQDNLVLRAALALQRAVHRPIGAQIALTKNIPTAAGLGGGSADAAAALVGLNALWNARLSVDELCALGASLGADVPFCIRGGTMRATGIGTDLTSLPPPPGMGLLLVKPCDGIATREIYRAFRLGLSHDLPDIPRMIDALHAGNLAEVVSSLGNALESAAFPMRPEIAETIYHLIGQGALGARMSGSGPTVFGIYPDEGAATAAQKTLGGTVCAPVRQSLIIEE